MHLLRFLVIAALLTFCATSPVRAVTLLRDPDIEHGLKRLAAPVLKAAGLSPTGIDILIVDDRSLNAFVVDSNHIFINSGLMLKMRTAPMLQSVIAHEAAHIANGHLVRRPVNLRNARTAAGIGSILAAAAVRAGDDHGMKCYCAPRPTTRWVPKLTHSACGPTGDSCYGNALDPRFTDQNGLLVPEDEVYDTDLSVEDAFKLVMSAGLVTPEDDEGGGSTPAAR